MKKLNLLIIGLSLSCLVNCATSASNLIKDSVAEDCELVGTVNSVGSHFIPPVASSSAKSSLVTKARELGANALVIQSKEGIIEVKMEGLAYKCPNMNPSELEQ
jgi:hypothetical protein